MEQPKPRASFSATITQQLVDSGRYLRNKVWAGSARVLNTQQNYFERAEISSISSFVQHECTKGWARPALSWNASTLAWKRYRYSPILRRKHRWQPTDCHLKHAVAKVTVCNFTAISVPPVINPIIVSSMPGCSRCRGGRTSWLSKGPPSSGSPPHTSADKFPAAGPISRHPTGPPWQSSAVAVCGPTHPPPRPPHPHFGRHTATPLAPAIQQCGSKASD